MDPLKLIVGAGFSGAVLAREIAEAGYQCLVIDKRDHIAGNCHTARESGTGVMEHVYGPHIFNTSNEAVWTYVKKFCVMEPFINRVKASTPRGVFSMPINLMTINQFFGKRFSPAEARKFISSLGDASIKEPANFEEQALKYLGREIYNEFFYGYSKKQWGCEPKELPASILKRLPVRFNYDDNYYNSRYQGIPQEGYSMMVERILDHPNIEIKLNTAWVTAMRDAFSEIFFTGPLDEFYGHRHGRLGYRTVFWEKRTEKGDFQGNAVINYPGMEVPFTRIIEHKHLAPWETHEQTRVFSEFSKDTGAGDIPYYPKRLADDMLLLESYVEDAQADNNVFFLGRLATYRYMDMDDVIAEALEFAKRYLRWKANQSLTKPLFADEEVLD
ncbi:MAG: NAD(P)-binding protein [Verrucomicrobia bacterium]|nr:NAD(P)-binding protein [Verrucomicrobiota bacterium]